MDAVAVSNAVADRPAASPPTWLTVDEAAKLARVSRRTIHNWIERELVTYAVRPTGTPLVDAASLVRTGEAAQAVRIARRQRARRFPKPIETVEYAVAAQEPPRMVSTPAMPGSAAITVAATRRVPLGRRVTS